MIHIIVNCEFLSGSAKGFSSIYRVMILKKKNSVVLVRKRTIPIERSPLVSEASANFSG
jgi:hypothetical protein